MYEPKLKPLGGGIQLNGGLATLASVLSSSEIKELLSLCVGMSGVISNTYVEGNMSELLRLDVEKAMSGIQDLRLRGDITCVSSVTILRGTLLKFLIEKCEEKKGGGRGVEATASKVFIKCDGSSGTSAYDLVLGCDGLSSSVKLSIPELRSSSIYSGLRILYSVSDPYEWEGEGGLGRKKELRQFFGEGCYQLKGTYGFDSSRVCDMSAIVYRGGKRGENVGWEEGGLYEDFVRKIGLVGGVREDVDESGSKFIELGVYFHNPFNRWSNKFNNVILAGDAAHAMPPFLGQGGNQGMQDGVMLGKMIGEGVEGEMLAKEFGRRWRKTTLITAKSVFLGYLETGEGKVGKFRDGFFKFAGQVGLAKKVFLDGAKPFPGVRWEWAGGEGREIGLVENFKLGLEVLKDPARFMDDE
ncbi:hypothetical protein TL16_g12771 [Triparma laevis f. inornata]|uniref:FAD-binding domain-containing protein n=1 Tax=Triparma laevis f. inornata TaxID=1714386 RepID=A0A9W7BT51_9STRA|nr:hypothetical protein TL16_g12771 [Triparma laevis f. inornata]